LINRYLKKTVEVKFENIQSGQNSIELEYYLLESEDNSSMESDCRKTYGVEIIKKYCSVPQESKSYKDIYSSREEIDTLVELLANNNVTPVHLPYILDDLLGV